MHLAITPSESDHPAGAQPITVTSKPVVDAAAARSGAIAALKAGVLPEEAIEHFRILPRGTTQAKNFQTALSSIYQRLVDAGILKQQETDFLLYDDKLEGKSASNAAYLLHSGRYFLFSASTFCGPDAAPTWDEVVLTVCHELFHRYYRSKYVAEGAVVNKFEEGAADLYVVYNWMRIVGANPRIALDLFARAQSGGDAKQSSKTVDRAPISWDEVGDVHVSSATSRALVEAALTMLEIRQGDCPTGYTKLSEMQFGLGNGQQGTLLEIVTQVDYCGVVRKDLEDNGYYTKTEPAERVQILLSVVSQLSHLNGTRTGEIVTALKQLKLDRNDSPQLALADQIADHLFGIVTAKNLTMVRQIYTTLCLRTLNADALLALGRARPIALAGQQFIDSATSGDNRNILAAATNLNSLVATEPLASCDIDRGTDSLLVALCGEGLARFRDVLIGTIVPWQPFIAAVSGRGAVNHPTPIVRALRIMGVDDPRLLQLGKGALGEELLQRPAYRASTGITLRAEIFGSILLDTDSVAGHVIDVDGRIRGSQAEQFTGVVDNNLAALQHRVLVESKWQFVQGQLICPMDFAGTTALLNNCLANNPDGCVNAVLQYLPIDQRAEHAREQHLLYQQLATHDPTHQLLLQLAQGQKNPINCGEPSGYLWRYVVTINRSLTPELLLAFATLLHAPEPQMENIPKSFAPNISSDLSQVLIPHCNNLLKRAVTVPDTVQDLVTMFSNAELKTHPNLRIVITFAALNYLSQHKSLNVAEAVALCAYLPNATKLIASKVKERTAADWVRQSITKKDLEVTVAEWRTAWEHHLLDSSDLLNKLSKILTAIKAVAPARQLHVLEKIITMKPPVNDITLLSRLNSLYGAALQREFGSDDGSPQFQDKLRTKVSELKGAVGIAHRVTLFAEIARALSTQRVCSYLLRDQLDLLAETPITSATNSLIIADAVANVAHRSDDHRAALIDLIFSRAKPFELDQFINTFREELLQLTAGRRFGHAGGRIGENIYGLYDQQGNYVLTSDSAVGTRTLNKMRDMSKRLHEAIWEAPLFIRAGMIAQLFFPDGASVSDREKIATAMLDRAIPDKLPGSQIAKAWWRDYIMALPAHKIPYYLGATMAACPPGSQTQQRPGDTIAAIADLLDPLLKKLVQQGSAHPGLPEELCPSPERVRCKLAVPPRWEFWEMIDTQLTQALRDDIAHLGEVEHAGSIYVTGQCKSRTHGAGMMLSIERPYTTATAETGAENVRKMLARRPENDPAVVEVQAAAKAAMLLLQEERAMQQLPAKTAAMKQQYSRFVIHVDGQPVKFSAVDLLHHEAKARMTREAPGRPLAEILATSQEGEQLQRVLIGHLTRELIAVFAGDPFCDDRHSGNLNVNEYDLIHYDQGGMSTEPASDQDMTLFGQVIGRALSESDSIEALLPKLTKAMTEAATHSAHLARSKRALATIAECFKYLPADDVKACLIAAVPYLHASAKAQAFPVLMAKLSQPAFAGLISTFQASAGRVVVEEL